MLTSDLLSLIIVIMDFIVNHAGVNDSERWLNLLFLLFVISDGYHFNY